MQLGIKISVYKNIVCTPVRLGLLHFLNQM